MDLFEYSQKNNSFHAGDHNHRASQEEIDVEKTVKYHTLRELCVFVFKIYTFYFEVSLF